ncbi:hypothetical protein GOBAR_DD34918 [Gossypium barbadense]|nr:hypothetical protein GOBAR_DD34918 [Gossypium barbadense]
MDGGQSSLATSVTTRIVRPDRSIGGRLSGQRLLNPMHHTMVNLKENRSPNVETNRAANQTENLEVGESSKVLSKGNMGDLIPVEQAVEGIVESLDMVERGGADHPNFHRFLKEYLKEFDFGVVVLVETRTSGVKADKVTLMFGEDDKQGGLRKTKSSCPPFQQFCDVSGLKDLGFKGSKYTWNRGQMFERIDRVLGNSQWEMLMPDTTVYNL